MIGYLLLMVFHWIAYKKKKKKKIFAEKQILQCSLFTLIAGLLIMGLYEKTLIRYIVITIIVIVYILRNSKQLLGTLKILRAGK